MSRFFLLAALFAALCGAGRAQFGNFGDKPVEITADGDTRFENGTAVADNNVQIHYNGISIYADHAEYNPDTRDVLLVGNVRIYSGTDLFNGQRVLYNLETKKTRALEFNGGHSPLKFGSLEATGFGTRQFTLRDSDITTSDSSMPDWHIQAKTIRIYTNDRVVLLNSTLYVGQIPIMWLPYAYSSLTRNGFQLTPGYYSTWGAYILTDYTFPLGSGDNFLASIRNDYRSLHGYALGFDANLKFGKDNQDVGKFTAYYANDTDPSAFKDPLPAPTNQSQSRYRVGYQQKLYLADDTYATFDMTKLSDQNFMQDFYPAENLYNPQPDNNVALTKLDDVYALSLVTRWQMNGFQETTQRKPEAAFDFKQEPLFGLPVFYDGTTSLGQLNRSFSSSTNPTVTNSHGLGYGATRFDTLHQLSAPMTLFGWLSTIPTVGVRGTFYSGGGYFSTNGDLSGINPFPVSTITNNSSATNALVNTGSVFRPIFNAGLENSFKISRSFDSIQSSWLGLDGLRHVFEPYSDLSYVYAGGPNVNQVLQFDRFNPNSPAQQTRSGLQPSSTQLQPLDFPEFAAIDSIDTWAIWRVGFRNRLQTRRDGETYDWLYLDTFTDVNGINPYINGPISNLNNRLTFAPVSWFNLRIGSQVPMDSEGFTEFNMDFNVMPCRNLSIGFGSRYLNNYTGTTAFMTGTTNSLNQSANQYPLNVYWKVNDHWSLSADEIYNVQEGQANSLIYQRYMINRDLSSWIMSLGVQVNNTSASSTQSGQTYYGALINFTLKDLPQVTLPLAFSPSTQAGSTSSSPLSPSR